MLWWYFPGPPSGMDLFLSLGNFLTDGSQLSPSLGITLGRRELPCPSSHAFSRSSLYPVTVLFEGIGPAANMGAIQKDQPTYRVLRGLRWSFLLRLHRSSFSPFVQSCFLLFFHICWYWEHSHIIFLHANLHLESVFLAIQSAIVGAKCGVVWENTG